MWVVVLNVPSRVGAASEAEMVPLLLMFMLLLLHISFPSRQWSRTNLITILIRSNGWVQIHKMEFRIHHCILGWIRMCPIFIIFHLCRSHADRSNNKENNISAHNGIMFNVSEFSALLANTITAAAAAADAAALGDDALVLVNGTTTYLGYNIRPIF